MVENRRRGEVSGLFVCGDGWCGTKSNGLDM